MAFRVSADVRLTKSKSSASPATIVYLIKNFDEKGAPGPSDILVRAYRSDGSEAQYVVITDGRPPIRSIINYERRLQASVDPLIRMVIKHSIQGTPLIPATCEAAWGPGHCFGPVSETIGGFSLERVSRSEPGMDGYVSEFLVAPALDYRPLKRTLTTPGGLVVQEWTAVDIRLGEPDSALFEIPDDYASVTRDAFHQKGMEASSKQPDLALMERFRCLEAGKVPAPDYAR